MHKLSTMEKFWTWIRNYANEKVRTCYMDHVGHDRKCPNCKTWTSEVNGCWEINDDPNNGMIELMTCIRCGYVSKWDCSGMLPTLAEDQGPKN